MREDLEALALRHEITLVDVTWQPGSWIADVTFEDGDGARAALKELEAADVRKLLSVEEKEKEAPTQSY